MPTKRRILRIVGVVTLVAGALFALGVVSGRIPLRPLISFAKFRLWPDRLRVEQLVKLRHPQTEKTVILLGTTHQYHYEEAAYSIWHVKAVVTGVGADTACIEMMADAVDGGRWGEGPVEMPFIAFAAKEAGLDVVGIDSGWDGGWQGRQARMYEQVKARLALPQTKTALVTSGFMHVSHFQRQFEEDGYVLVPWSDAEKLAITDRAIPHTWPPGLKEALESAIARAKAGEVPTDPDRKADFEWFVKVREMVLRQMP